jgi:hypothetical protein
MAAGRVDLYNKIQHINPDEEAGNRQIYQRHWIEVGAGPYLFSLLILQYISFFIYYFSYQVLTLLFFLL